MYKIFIFLGIVFLGACTAQQPKVPPTALEIQQLQQQKQRLLLQRSLKSWQKIKNKQGAHYSYDRDTTLGFGVNASTKITVINGQAEYRDYFEWLQGDTPARIWSEPFAQLHTHTKGAHAYTIEQLYTQCSIQLLNKPVSTNHIALAFDQFNILQQCNYTKKDCTEKCSVEINIKGLSMLQTRN